MLRRFTVTARRSALDYLAVRSFSSRLDDAAKRLKTLSEEPENDVKLQIYALFKQATVGDVNIAKPGALDFVGKAKWAAWKKVEGVAKDKAEDQYVSLVDSLLQAEQKSADGAAASTMDSVTGLVKSLENGVLTVRFDRQQRRNAMTLEMYRDLTRTINDAANDNAVNFFVLTGTGDFFSSGNDLNNFIEKLKTGADVHEMARDSAKLVLDYVRAFIDFPKPMVALVNGPSIGIGCTILGLFDLVYASDKAYFQTPFSQLGLNPEGCSSFTFPQLFGGPLAAEVLLMNKKVTAEEALRAKFVTDVFPADSFEAECRKRIDYISKQPPKSLMYSKMLIREPVREVLIRANEAECKRLEERFTSDEAMKAVASFFKSKSSKM